MYLSIIGVGFIVLGLLGVYAFIIRIFIEMVKEGDRYEAMLFGSAILILTGGIILGIISI